MNSVQAGFQRRQEAFVTTVAEQIRQATTSPMVPAAASTDPSGNATATLAISPQGSTASENQGLNTGTRVGLAMIPVIVAVVGLYILFLFWFRRRRIVRKTRADIPPAVPEKDLYSYSESFDNDHRTSKVHNLTAFSTPIHDRNCQAQVYKKNLRQKSDLTINGKGNGSATTNDIPVPSRGPHMVESGDSPIDGSSPFRLKRGDTVKRVSLGPDLARLWPSPPPSAWLKHPIMSETIPPLPYPAIPERRSSRKAVSLGHVI